MATVLLPVFLVACARPGAESPLAPVAVQAPGASDHTILVATTRKRSADPGTLFSGERAHELDFAQAVVSIPPAHVPGAVEWPKSQPGNPYTDFVTREAFYIDGEKQWVAALNRQLARRPPGHRTVFLYVHGYNTLFPEGLYHLAQIAQDAKSESVPVYFT